MKKFLCFLGTLFCFQLPAQVNYTAQDQVTPYNNTFGYGTNMGVYDGWSDQDLAVIAKGDPSQGVAGAGCNTLRPTLPEWFLEYWGYDIRVDAFAYYTQLGVRDNVVFIGYPSEAHRDPTVYCNGVQSNLFSNLYLPIWDGGANGTPVNDDNHYALYLYRMVNLYGEHVRFWEVWNEPDFDFSNNAYKAPGEPGNWWENVPQPCDYQLGAPVFHYIRMLRITYEVIKSLDPNAYISVGGIGYPSFLDIMLRHTDEPEGGTVTSEYPLTGGAYFDAISYHTYPHYDGSMRWWDNDIGGFAYNRNSDEAVKGMLRRKDELEAVLENYGYNGSSYPEKVWLITESHLPSASFDPEFYGSDEAQRNFLMKAAVACQKNDIVQFHVYKIGEHVPRPQASNEFDRMGLYQNFSNVPLYQAEITECGIGYRTLHQTIGDAYYDTEQTAALGLPELIEGAAFRHPDGQFSYVLWARTTTDESESASAQYSFPPELGINQLARREWDFGATGVVTNSSTQNIPLTGAPSIFSAQATVSNNNLIKATPTLEILPNPMISEAQVQLQLPTRAIVDLHIMDTNGKLVYPILSQQDLAAGSYQFELDNAPLSPGLYFLQFKGPGQSYTIKLVKQ